MLPALSSAKHSARQVHLAGRLYADDWEDYFPPHETRSQSTRFSYIHEWEIYKRIRWHHLLRDGYLSDTNVFRYAANEKKLQRRAGRSSRGKANPGQAEEGRFFVKIRLRTSQFLCRARSTLPTVETGICETRTSGRLGWFRANGRRISLRESSEAKCGILRIASC